MKIEIKKLQISASLSEETTAYTADIFVDGVKTFAASNHGTGGCDMFHRYPGAQVTEADVNAWLADNCPPDGPWEIDPAKRPAYDMGTTCNLETFVGRIVSRAESEKEGKRIRAAYARMLAKSVGALRPDGAFVTFKALPTPANLASVRRAKPDFVILNDADDATKEKGLRAYCPNLGETARDTDEEALHEAVMERQRQNQLTVADAKFLLAQERAHPNPTTDYMEWLAAFIATGEAAYAAYCAERDAKRDDEMQRAARDAAGAVIGQVS